MKRIGKTTIFVVLALVLALGAYGVHRATAVEPGKYLVYGNPSCATLYEATVLEGPGTSLADLGPLFGFKIDNYSDYYAPPSGDLEFTLTAGTQHGYPTVLTDSTPSDPDNSVTLINSSEYLFDWAATLGIDAVIVKAQDANAYVYAPEAFGASGLEAPDGKSISHIEFCYDYELTAEKTADAEYTRTYTWEITKDFDGEYWKFIGDAATPHGYKVSVDQTVTDSDFIVTGEITVNNPTPYTVGFSVSDLVDGILATVDCTSYELAPGGSTTCTYSADLGDTLPPDGTNVATITSSNTYVDGATATDTYTFGDPTTTVGFPEINVTDTNGGSWAASGDATWTYTKDFECPTDTSQYVNGVYTAPDDVNTAEITETEQSDDATVKLTCYAPVPSKTAEASYTATYTWEITKDFDGEYWKFIGDAATTHDYKVSVDQTITDSPYLVTGVITVQNPNPKAAMNVSLADSVGGMAATLDCGGTLSVPAGGSATCGYSAELAAPTDGTNTATVTLNTIDFPATRDYTFTRNVVGFPEINVTDTNGGAWTASGDAYWEYTKNFECPTDTSLYVDGVYTALDDVNTAKITETGQSDDATVKLTCYAPVPSKTADASYTATYTWEITKDFDGTYDKFIGDPATTHGYTVSVDQTITDSPYRVTGVITVKNPNPKAAMNVSLADSVGGTAATLDCGGTLSVPAGGSATCGYSAVLAAPTDGTNTATVTLNTIDFPATKDYTFTRNVEGYPEIHVTDTNGGAWTASGDAYWEYTKNFECPTDTSQYVDGVYTAPDDVNTAEITETGQSDDATVKLTCYAPVISKDAYGAYDEYHDWTVDKSVDPTQQSAFIGDTVDFDWTVTVNEEIWEENFGVTGQINVYNPAPMAMTVALADVLNDGTVATITDCSDSDVTWDGTNLYIPAGITAICDYEAADTGGPGLNNFAAALPDQVTFNVTYPAVGGEAYFPTVTVSGGTVLDGTYPGWCVDTDNTINQGTTYTGDVYSTYEELPAGAVEHPENFDLVNWILNQDFVGTDAGGGLGDYTYSDVQYAIWTLIDDATSTAGLYTLNYTRAAQIVAAAQAYGEGFTPDCNDFIAVVLQPVNGAQVIAVAQVTMIEVDLECPAENTATATLNDIDFSASADIVWTKTVVHEGVTLDDDQNDAWPIDLTDGGEWTYADSYECSTNPDDYVDGGGTTYQAKIENTATLYDGETELDDDYAYTLVDCYIPTISKTAAGTYDERHEWTVDKTVTPLEQGGYPGDELGWTWTVKVTEYVYEENFDVAGTITVVNPNPEDVLVVSLADVLSDGTAAVIDQTSCAFDGTNLTVQPSSSETCDYTANDLVDGKGVGYADDAAAPNNNTASIVLNGITFSDDDAIEWTANQIREDATLDDDLNPDTTWPLPLDGHDQAGTYTFGPYSYSESHTCSSDRVDYFVDGVYTPISGTPYNEAWVDSDGEEQDRDDATTTWTCDASFVDIYKTTNGQPADPEDDIQFVLYSYAEQPPNEDPKLRVPTEEEIVSTMGNGANLQFQTALYPGDTYTICEYPVPAAYTFEISVNGDLVLTYAGPPGEGNPTGEIQCFDFTAPDPLTQVTIEFDVENRFPGGAPRTPGYWKNWNRCSGGNQEETADKLNDGLDPSNPDSAGVFLLDDLLPQTIGSFEIASCQYGVAVLSAQTVDKGKNMANDAAYTLARALLAARLNQDAGACPVAEWQWDAYKAWYLAEYGTEIGFEYFEDVLTEADTLLADLDNGNGFDGTGDYLGPKNKKDKDLAAYALFLYGIIDDYNNSEICTGDPSH